MLSVLANSSPNQPLKTQSVDVTLRVFAEQTILVLDYAEWPLDRNAGSEFFLCRQPPALGPAGDQDYIQF